MKKAFIFKPLNLNLWIHNSTPPYYPAQWNNKYFNFPNIFLFFLSLFKLFKICKQFLFYILQYVYLKFTSRCYIVAQHFFFFFSCYELLFVIILFSSLSLYTAIKHIEVYVDHREKFSFFLLLMKNKQQFWYNLNANISEMTGNLQLTRGEKKNESNVKIFT